jgi:hypothetical protein
LPSAANGPMRPQPWVHLYAVSSPPGNGDLLRVSMDLAAERGFPVPSLMFYDVYYVK